MRASEQDREHVAQARQAWWTEAGGVGGIDPERLVFLDECGVLTNMVRLYGHSPRGQCAYGTAPGGRWTRLTVLGALGAYLDRVLLPELRRTRPDAVLVMDNLHAHKTAQVRGLLDRSGFAYRYLPPYSPDLNPIEPAWAKLKTELRHVAARTTDALHQALGPALGTITPQNAAGCFRY